MRPRALLGTAMVGALLGAGVAACVSFDLGSRRFRCEEDPSICGTGWTCGPDGFCVETLADGGPGDGGAAADGNSGPDGATGADADTGDEDCDNGEDDDGDDQTDCEDGDCENAPCGIGCTCKGGEAVEEACGDHEDNDGDELVDCNDADCPSSCTSPLVCCPDGCRTGC